MCDADLAAPIEGVKKLLACAQRQPKVTGSRPLEESFSEARQPRRRELLERAAILRFARSACAASTALTSG